MCGIFGVVAGSQTIFSNDILKNISKNLFLLSESRGKEASGIAGIVNSNIIIHKSPHPAKIFTKSVDYKNLISQIFNSANSNQAFFGHSRLVTDGYEHKAKNNQPVNKKGLVAVHNGIIVNKNKLWEYFSEVNKESDLDSELIPMIIRDNLHLNEKIESNLKNLFAQVEGVLNTAIFISELNNLFLATNNGSVYYLPDLTKTTFIFASEKYILKELINKFYLKDKFDVSAIKRLYPNHVMSISLENSLSEIFDIKNKNFQFNNIIFTKNKKIIESHINHNQSLEYKNTSLENVNISSFPHSLDKIFDYRYKIILEQKRCQKCLLPKSFPFIKYDKDGICNICKKYKKNKPKGELMLEKDLKFYSKNNKDKYDCLVALSGGRDSSYSLYYIKEVLGLNPLAFSYDWGMLTDLGRRNQSRVCSKLGVEHILVSADIRKKRRNIKLNVEAWLKNPSMGTVPLFMAGDKQYFYFANLIKSQNDIDIVIMAENIFEKTGFKIMFSGAKQKDNGYMSYHMSSMNKLNMLMYYAKEFLKNPSFINPSIIDSASAFFSYYMIPHNYLNIFDYLKWEEEKIDKKIIEIFEWETDPNSPTTWRIGDGTAAFYNYIYLMSCGFNENDTFRSNQIREGQMSREDAYSKLIIENRPRWDSMQWYFNTIQVDFKNAINIVNNMKPLY